jgi:tRNA pseudouridine13 synthase
VTDDREKRGFETEWATVSDSILSVFFCAPSCVQARHFTLTDSIIVKLKQLPEDFRVEEITSASSGQSGPFALYRLHKKNWTTPDALNSIRLRWNIPFSRFSYGGLKDRHAETIQYVTIFHGPKRNFTQPGIALSWLGQRDEPFTSTDIEANRFVLTLRSLSPGAVDRAREALIQLERIGVPNYFDDQRFGSVAHAGQFVAKEMVLGRYEAALKLALTSTYEHDRGPARREKALLRDRWGDWPKLKTELGKGYVRSLVDHLVRHPTDFRGALERLKPELRSLYLAAWQSYLWNKMLALWLQTHVSPNHLLFIRSRFGELPVPRQMSDQGLAQWRSLTLPLPSARLKIDPEAAWAPLVESVMNDEELPLNEMKLKGFRKPFFSKGDRPAALFPNGLRLDSEADELHRGKEKLVLHFDLPRGCYATMIVKRLTQTLE